MNVYFEKDNMHFEKEFKCESLEECYKQLKQTIDQEIKI